ncbi:hypothetical protein LZ495_00645 [Yinghuangia sp. KLBMP8922]|uniref:Uncharacterized protein n=2 Tax=Yinghuangia soli TaxID=2908204 RepID=A0AA41TXV8_9ACTN|nr:hypothetical protein [Yinghuangia soli]
MAVEYRLENEHLGAGQNVAVFEFETPDGLFHNVNVNIPKGKDAEVVIAEELARWGVDPLAVTRIYSERIPCGPIRQNCRALLTVYKNAKVSYSLNGGYTADKDSIFKFMKGRRR